MKIGVAGPISPQALMEHLSARVADIPIGLGSTPVTLLVRGLLQKGYHVSVFSLSKDITRSVVLRGERLKIYFGTYRAEHRMRDLMRVERETIADFILDDRPDIVHAHWTYEFALGTLKTGIPSVITVHDWAPAILRLSPDAYRFGRLLLNLVVLRKAKSITAVSHYIHRQLSRLGKQTVAVIPNAIDEAVFRPRVRTLNAVEPVIISVNNGFSRLKNVRTLFQAFASIRCAVPDATLCLVGVGFGEDGEAARWADSRRLSAGVKFMGSLGHERTLHEIAQADLLIHPSLEESFGMTLIEAMAQATPVLGGRSSGAVPGVLGHGKGGILVDVCDAECVARAAVEVLTDEEKWRQIGSAGQEFAWNHFRLSVVTDLYIALYRTILCPVRPVDHEGVSHSG